MSAIIVSIDNINQNQIDNIKDCLFDFGIETLGVLQIVKKNFDLAYEYIKSSYKIVILTGNILHILDYLKNRFGCKTENTVFMIAGIKWVKCDTFDSAMFVHEIIPKISSSKSKFQSYQFRAYAKSSQEIEQLLVGFKYPKGILKYEIDTKLNDTILNLMISEKLDPQLKIDVLNRITEFLLDSLYSVDKKSLIETVVAHLRQYKYKVALAESYTAGGIASSLASLAGASEYLIESIVCYSNFSKSMRLGLDLEQLNINGAINENTVYDMAVSLLKQTNCDIVIATSGYASPQLNSKIKSYHQGRTYLAIGNRQGIRVFSNNFEGSRSDIIQQGINHALFSLYKLFV
ncbi:MAG: CinA family protein [Firmicutes bacterium]|nr:CinA family protein [Bacillota bacterium]MCL1954280.1 CinA family protein [Bacillota bacterium]